MKQPFLPSLVLAGVSALTILLTAPPVRAEYHPKGKRDPFVPLLTSDGQLIHPPGLDEGEATGGLAALALQGVLFDPGAESFAVINGRLVREQEEVEGVKVLKIAPNMVTVLADGQSHELVFRQKPTEEERSTEP